MRKYVSLGTAMMMGAVLGIENYAKTIAGARTVPKAIQAAQIAEPTYLERPVKLHPRRDSVGNVEAERASNISSHLDFLSSRDSYRSQTSRRHVKNRSKYHRSFQRKESNSPKVK